MIDLDTTIDRLFQRRSHEQRFVFGLGDISKQAYATGFSTEAACFAVGAWGLPGAIGLGLALANPGLQIIVVDGDGAVLHAPGHLAMLADLALTNFHLVVINNGVLQSSGGQRIAALQRGVSIARIIRAHGFSDVVEVAATTELECLSRAAHEARFSIVHTAVVARRRGRVPLAAVRAGFQPVSDPSGDG